MDNVFIVMFLFWPAVVLLCAGLNMLLSWTFSWSELVFDYFIGMLAGYFLFVAAQGSPDGAHSFFFVFSHGFLGLLWLTSEGFRTSFESPATFLWTMAGIRLGATLWAAAWDHVSVALGAKLSPGPFFFSLVVAPAKWLFSSITSAFGVLIWIAGAIWAAAGSGKAGFAGGVLFTEFSPGGGGYYATTVGFTVQTWNGNCPFKHELYHTRQYIYMCDWLMPFWVVGMLWGVISAAIAQGTSVSYALAIGADASKEVGNPIEVAAYHM
jgi:hypothetical protein